MKSEWYLLLFLLLGNFVSIVVAVTELLYFIVIMANVVAWGVVDVDVVNFCFPAKV